MRLEPARRAAVAAVALLLLGRLSLEAQLVPLPQSRGAAGLALAMRRLPVVGSVLYVTAHPDDEHNGVLVRLSRGLGLRVGLLTMTRGEGGQNEIGPELGEALGVLRTEELAAVHRYDGAEQLFGRAYDFGYSFSVDETLRRWGHDQALGDVVRGIRKFRPDVILTLPLQGDKGGRHHEATAWLAREAFRAAADPSRFPEQVAAGLPAWQAGKLYQGATGSTGEKIGPAPVTLNVGAYDPLLGMSWQQLGNVARSMHRCQGQGQGRIDPLEGEGNYSLVDSEPPATGVESDILDGIDVGLRRLVRSTQGERPEAKVLAPDVEKLGKQIEAAQSAFDPRRPQQTVPGLAAGLETLRRIRARLEPMELPPASRSELIAQLAAKERDFLAALALAQGLAFEARSDDDLVVPGQSFSVTASVWNQGSEAVEIDDLSLAVPEGWTAERVSGDLHAVGGNASLQLKFQVKVAEGARYSRPYWRRPAGSDRYDLDVPAFEGLPWSRPEVVAWLGYHLEGVAARMEEPAIARSPGHWLGGERQRLVGVVPALSLQLAPAIVVLPAGTVPARGELRARVFHNGKEAVSASLRLELPAGWKAVPSQAPLSFRREGDEDTVRFQISPPTAVKPGDVEVRAVATSGGREFREGYRRVAYDHIQERAFFEPAAARVKVIDFRVPAAVSVGYIMGAGDEVPDALVQLGIPVTLLGEDALATGDLSRYTTILTGIRAYQARPDLRAHNQRLLRYVEEGGNLVVQYNGTDFNYLGSPPPASTSKTEKVDSPFAPYPGVSVGTGRVTDETAPMTVLAPGHPLLTYPNRIRARDWEGWVQERGVNFLEVRDARYRDLLASADPFPDNAGEKRGILVDAQVGKGRWTYVALGLFRQLPAGTDGAYRLLANLVARPRGR